MADRKISDLTALTTPASGDYLPIVDISEAAAASKNKRITIEELMRGVPDGTAAAPGIAFETDPNTGIYSPGANQVAVATNGVGRLFVDADGALTVTRTGLSGNVATFNGQNGVFQINSTRTTGGSYSQIIGTYGGNATDFWKIGSNAFTDGSFAIWAGAGAQERLRITSGGLVGIGTNAPGAPFTTYTTTPNTDNTSGVCELRNTNSTPVAGTDSVNMLRLVTNTSNGYTAALIGLGKYQNDSNGRGEIKLKVAQTSLSSSLTEFSFRGDGQFTVPNRVGIGTASPGSALEINAAAATSPFIAKINTAEAARIDSSGRLLVGTSTGVAIGAGSEALIQGAVSTGFNLALYSTINSSGAGGIAIGKSRNGAVVQNNDDLGSIVFAGHDGTDYQTRSASIAAFVDGTPGANDMPGRLTFSTTADGASSPTQHLYISSEGYVVPGTNTVIALPDANCGPGLKLVATTNNTGARLEGVAGSASTRYHAAFSNPNGLVGSISTNASATAYNTSSDYRLKENVTAVSDGITRLQQLKPSRFNFIADSDRTVDGFLAHEVQTIVPEAITGEKDAVDDNGNPEYQGIDQSKLVPLLTAALQEAIGEIEALKARVAALEAN
jgi:hypothetical protein